MLDRLLAAEEQAPLDYTVFSVVIATLCIVLVVEVLRHQLDVKASGNPFFQTVLELMYRELTTLGIVEFFIYLMHKYHENFNYAMEVVFVDVHFMLFYTALFNAIQSVLVRLVTARRTDKAWIQTEEIDIGHYVAIRKEFDRVENEWKQLQYNMYGSRGGISSHSSFLNNSINENTEVELVDGGIISKWGTVKLFFQDVYMKLRYPRLFLRKRKLMIPVRFHELRHHFIEQNGLSSKFKVSQYLKRSLTSVLLDFVHISSAAWIMIMALSIILYYISGITLNVTADKLTVYEFLVGAMASGVVLFLIISIVLYFKMRGIISKMLVMKLHVQDDEGRETTFRGFSALRTKLKSYDQINLFWMGNPRIIIVLTQFMQFGYALALAAIFTYWTQIEETDFKEKLLVVLLFGYGIYLHILSAILPWFTVCTSLGQLVNKERLHETMAKMKLGEELRRAEAAAEAAKIEKEISLRRRQVEEKLQAKKKREEEMIRLQEHNESGSSQTRKSGRERSLSGGIGLMRLFHDRSATETTESSGSRHAKRKSLSDGVDIMTTLDMASNSASNSTTNVFNSSARFSDAASEQLGHTAKMGSENVRVLLSEKEERNQPKTEDPPSLVSKILQNTQSAGMNINGSANSAISRQERKHRRTKSKSAGVTFMRSSFDKDSMLLQPSPLDQKKSQDSKLLTLTELVTTPAEDLPPVPDVGRRKRESRLRAISEGVSLMQAGPIPSKLTSTTHAASLNNTSGISDNTTLSREQRKQRRRLMKCQSEGVASMRLSLDTSIALHPSPHVGEIICQQPKLETLSELVNIPAKDLPELPEKGRKKRKSRLRSISDGVSLMRALKVDDIPTVDDSLNKMNAVAVEVENIPNGLEKKDEFAAEDGVLTDTSVESVNGDSDIDDVPDILPSEEIIVVRTKKKLENADLAEVLQGHRYHILSLLFGPMACCFWVAMRVEGFNMAEGVLIDYHNTFHLQLSTCFWVETAWLCLMIIERLVALIVFTREHNPQEILSAIMGATNVATCLTLLMVAEIKRCCSESESNSYERLLAADSAATDYSAAESPYISECTCDAFGSRLYGGLGIVEPFTFLMALGPLRFIVAGPITRMLGIKTHGHDIIDGHHSDAKHDDHHGPGPDEARNIWLTTIGLHSEVAKTHGLFSVQVLYCMLGLQAPQQKSLDTHADIAPEFDSPNQIIEPTQLCTPMVAPEEETNNNLTNLKNSLGIVFDEDEFAYPDSKLIRRMRRCERRMLPLLDTWMLVDVVLTNHELVLFEVPEDSCYSPESSSALVDGGKGLSLNEVGKGRSVVSKFSLNEIDFIDIEHSLSINAGDSEIRDIESKGQDLGEFWQGCYDALTYDPDDMSKRWCRVDEDRLKIHFTGGCGTLYLRLLVDLKDKEGNKDATTPLDVSPSLLSCVGTETKIWCRTIARLCGAANLKMDLPHFGDTTGDDELGDFVKVTERDSNGIKQHRRRLTRLPSQIW